MSRIQSPRTHFDQSIATVRDRILPALGKAHGYLGAALYADRDTGRAAEVTFWDGARSLSSSEGMALAARAEAAEKWGLRVIDVTRFEVVSIDQAGPPKASGFIRVDNGATPPERLDAFAAFIRAEVGPTVRQCPGYRSLALAIDRNSGLVAVTSTWESAADREAGDSAFAAVLRRAEDFQMRPILIELYEQVGVV